jgi:hypothetical protein
MMESSAVSTVACKKTSSDNVLMDHSERTRLDWIVDCEAMLSAGPANVSAKNQPCALL